MSPRDRTSFHDLPPWKQGVLTYLGLGVEASVRPRWYRVLSAVAATVLAAATVMALVEGRWFAALGSAGLTVLIGSGTRP